jgi:hypothetical protein
MVKKIEGAEAELADDLARHLRVDREQVRVNPVTRHVEVKVSSDDFPYRFWFPSSRSVDICVCRRAITGRKFETFLRNKASKSNIPSRVFSDRERNVCGNTVNLNRG